MRGARFFTLQASLLSTLSVPARASAQTTPGGEATSAWGTAAFVAVVHCMAVRVSFLVERPKQCI